jgi:hypothetical protein
MPAAENADCHGTRFAPREVVTTESKERKWPVERFATWLKKGLRFIEFVLMAIAGFVLFLAVAVMMRPLLMATFIIAALGGSLLYSFSSRFRDWVDAASQPQAS